MKIEIKPKEKDEKTSKIIKYLSIDKTKIPMTEEEYNFMRAELDKHIEKHGIMYGFIYNLFLKEDENEQESEN